MSVAAVMLVRDEADIVEVTVRHLLANVDQLLVADNLSTDGTRVILDRLAAEHPNQLTVVTDGEVGYYQSRKTTEMAGRMLERGHQWVIPCDADEIWLSPDGRTLANFLAGIPWDVQAVRADVYNHVCTAKDDRRELDPTRRICWRQTQPLPLGKVACRLRPDLTIHAGNHSSTTEGPGLVAAGLQIRHFPYRSEDQFVRKAMNGAEAYAATDLPESTGVHWRMYGRMVEEHGVQAAAQWFRDYFVSPRPEQDGTLMRDQAPVRR